MSRVIGNTQPLGAPDGESTNNVLNKIFDDIVEAVTWEKKDRVYLQVNYNLPLLFVAITQRFFSHKIKHYIKIIKRSTFHVSDEALENHVICSSEVSDATDCRWKCVAASCYVSYNFQYTGKAAIYSC